MPRRARPIKVEGCVAYIPLTRGYTAIIDAEDVSLVDGRCWSAWLSKRENGTIRGVYAHASYGAKLHRVIMNAPEGIDVDHINGDSLDCRKSNMRLATRQENSHNCRMPHNNTSGAKGVSLDKRCGKWRAYININGVMKSLGYYNTVAEASSAYADASKKYHKEFGRV